MNPRAPLSWDLSVPPLNEQQLIAHILDTLDTQIRRTEEVIAKLEQVKQGLLTDLRTRGIDENGELRPSTKEAPELYKDSRVGRIPLEWSVLPISDVVDLPSGQVSPLASEYRDMPLVAPDHIEAGTGKLLDVESAAEQGAISGKYVFRPRDVIYSKIRPYLKKAWLADRHGLCSADMYPLRPRPGHSPVFVLNILLGNEFSSFANSVSMRTGIPKINRSELRTYETAVPPANEQRRIESTIEASDTDLENERVALGKLLNTKVGLMDDLLTGRVRVIPLLEEAEQAVG